MFLDKCMQFVSSLETFQAFIAQDLARWQHTIGFLLGEAFRCEELQNHLKKTRSLV